jgi:hypothetical protein
MLHNILWPNILKIFSLYILGLPVACRPVSLSPSACLNHLNVELNPICLLLALLGAHHILYVSGIRVRYCTYLLHGTETFLRSSEVLYLRKNRVLFAK